MKTKKLYVIKNLFFLVAFIATVSFFLYQILFSKTLIQNIEVKAQTTCEIYVSPNGGGSGTIDSPVDIRTALGDSGLTRPGCTVWLRGGAYNMGQSSIRTTVNGTADAPIIVRQYPGERATVDGRFDTEDGSYVIFWGFEIINTAGRHVNGSYPPRFIRGPALAFYGPGFKAINMIIHDSGHPGISAYTEAVSAEIYGNIIWGSGMFDHTFGSADSIEAWSRGEAWYTQSDGEYRLIGDNISFRNFSGGGQSYGNVRTDGFVYNGNASFDNRDQNLTVASGDTSIQNITMTENYTYRTDNQIGVALGLYNSGSLNNRGLVLTNNYFVNGNRETEGNIWMKSWSQGQIDGNTFVTQGSNAMMIDFWEIGSSRPTWNNNSFYGLANRFSSAPGGGGTSIMNMSQFLTAGNAGTGSGNTFTQSLPSTNAIFVRPNKYEPCRGHVIVYNWQNLSSVNADISEIVLVGDRYQILDAQNYYGGPVAEGTYSGGSVPFPMNLSAVAPISGTEGWINNVHTAPRFAVFVVIDIDQVGSSSCTVIPGYSDEPPPVTTPTPYVTDVIPTGGLDGTPIPRYTYAAPYPFPCDLYAPESSEWDDLEFHSLRPYQVSPCLYDATDLAMYCGSSFVLSDTIVVESTYDNPPVSASYTYEGNPIEPVEIEDSFGLPACNQFVNGVCIRRVGGCNPEGGCELGLGCVENCINNGDGTQTCTFEIDRTRDVSIDLSEAEFPIMGNTDYVVNSEVQPEPEPLDAYDPTKVNEYVSWYLNGVIGRAEYPALDTENPEDVKKIVDFSGPIKKFLSFDSQITERANEVERGDEGVERHDQVVGCDDGSGNPVECYPQSGGGVLRRLTDWLDTLPPVRTDFETFGEYWDAYSDWRNASPGFIGNLFSYIPFSSTEDRRGIYEAIISSIQPAQENVRIISASLTQVPADLFFAHIDETAELADTLQKTFAFLGAELNGPPSNISDSPNPYCDLVQVRSNPGDDLFATELLVHVNYTAQVDCDFLVPYLESNPAEGVPVGNLCTSLVGQSCQTVSSGDYCEVNYGQVDCLDGQICGSNCAPLPGPGDCGVYAPGYSCVPASWSCDFTFDAGFSICPSSYQCGMGCSSPGPQTPNLSQSCSATINVNLGTLTQTPRADELWSRFVSGPAGIFRRVFPKIETDAPVEALWDIPASTTVTYTPDAGVTYVGIPGSPRTEPELYFPHIGSIHEYFLKCIQTALRPQGFGEPCLSGTPGTNAPVSDDCPAVADASIPSRWLGPMKENYARLAEAWCGGVGENRVEECYNYVVQQSINAGVNPAFTLTIWLNETAASNYECSGNVAVQDFGINDPSIYMNLVAQLERLLQLPFNSTYIACRSAALSAGLDPMFGFLDRFRDGNCDLLQSNSNQGWVYYNAILGFTWPITTEPLGYCVSGGQFSIQWPTDNSCP